MTDKESLDRAVEEARTAVVSRHVNYVRGDWSDHGEEISPHFSEWESAVDALIEAVRRQERERAEVLFLAAEDGLGALSAMLFVENPPRDHALETMHWLQETLIPWQADRALCARSSEEAGG